MSKKLETWKEVSMGAIITKPGNIAEYKTGGWRSFRPVKDEEKCNNCGLCWIFCPDAAIEIDEKGDYKAPNLDYCKGCGICSTECPLKALEMVEEGSRGA
ncbi:MAG: Pyruvate synthase subunit PorD [Candidatus Bathyarchaeota archaeon BA1]|nr:MAG: Pyruvate synthase subunit PorD [Candidatus Bathyarchaeota archaeon BA1]